MSTQILKNCFLAMAFLLAVTSVKAASNNYNAAPAPHRPKVLFDYYRHSQPKLPLGNNLLTGGYENNVGRYGINDFPHSNSFDPLFQTLDKDFELRIHRAPMTAENLSEADIVVIFTPASPKNLPDIPVLSDQEIDDLEAWVHKGGSLFLMANSYHKTEHFESEQFRKLFQRFGLNWNDDDTHYVTLPLPGSNPFFYDIGAFHYGAGCTIDIAPEWEDRAEIVLQVHGDIEAAGVSGPGIVLVKAGKGKVMAVGDTGAWTANLSRPDVQNTRVLEQLFRWLAPDSKVEAPEFHAGEAATYRFTASDVTLVPTANTLNQIAQPAYRPFEPRPKTQIPYLETSGKVSVHCSSISSEGVVDASVQVQDFTLFGKEADSKRSDEAALGKGQWNRRGVLISWTPGTGPNAVLGADWLSLVAFLPTDGIRAGDRWTKEETVKVPGFQADRPGSFVTLPLETTYVADEDQNGQRCRFLRTEGRLTLREAGISPAALIPGWTESSPHQFLYPDGGTIHIRRESRVDAKTGRVLSVRSQTRVTSWIQDKRNPPGKTVDQIDNHSLAIITRVVEFEKTEP